MPAHFLPISRRRFLAGSAAAVTTLSQGELLAAQAKPNPDAWAIFSDTHLVSSESIAKHYSSRKAAMEKRATVVSKNFDRAAVQLKSLKQRPAGMILNGDCVHVGGKEEYVQLANKFAQLETFPIHVTMGNHDHRGDFTSGFNKQLKRSGKVLLANRHVSILRSRHANFVLLDSLTMKTPERPVKGPGVIGKEQLRWLESSLDAIDDKPAIVVFHHNIDPSEDYQKRYQGKKVVVESAGPFKGLAGGLEDSDQLLDLLQQKKHVKAVVTGHMHQYRVFHWCNIHFISLPSVGYTFDAKEPVGWIKLQLKESGADLELQTLDTKHARHHHRASLTWS